MGGPEALLQAADSPEPFGIGAAHRDRMAGALDRPADRLADPPVGEGAEAVPLRRVEPLDRSGQADVPFLDQVQQLQRRSPGAHPGDEPNDQPQVRRHEPLAGSHAGAQRPPFPGSEGAIKRSERHGDRHHPPELQLLRRGQQGVASYFPEVPGQRRIIA